MSWTSNTLQDPKLKTLVLTTSYPNQQGHGSGLYIQKLVHALTQRGVICEVVVPQSCKDASEQELENLVYRFPYTFFRKGSLVGGAGILSNLRERPTLALQIPGIVVGFLIHLWKSRKSTELIYANWLFCGYLAWGWSYFFLTPFVVTVRGSDFRLLHYSVFSWLTHRMLKRAAFVTCVSSEIFNGILKKFPHEIEKIKLIRNGVESRELMALAPQAVRVATIVFVGRVVPDKGVEDLIRLLAAVDNPHITLELIGPCLLTSYREKLQTLSRELSISERVIFCGELSHSAVLERLNQARYYASWSRHEGLPNSVLEAIASGCVVIGSDIAGHREVIAHEKNGYLYPLDQILPAAECISRLEESGSARQSIADAARSTVESMTWEQCADEYAELFHRAAAA